MGMEIASGLLMGLGLGAVLLCCPTSRMQWIAVTHGARPLNSVWPRRGLTRLTKPLSSAASTNCFSAPRQFGGSIRRSVSQPPACAAVSGNITDTDVTRLRQRNPVWLHYIRKL